MLGGLQIRKSKSNEAPSNAQQQNINSTNTATKNETSNSSASATLQRDNWMVQPPKESLIGKIIGNKEQTEKSKIVEQKPVQYKELNPNLNNNAQQNTSTEKQIQIGDGGQSWRNKALQRAKERNPVALLEASSRKTNSNPSPTSPSTALYTGNMMKKPIAQEVAQISSNAQVDVSKKRKHSEIDTSSTTQPSDSIVNAEADLNKLNAKLIKAQMMKDEKTIAEIQKQIDSIKKPPVQKIQLPQYDLNGKQIITKLNKDQNATVEDMLLEERSTNSLYSNASSLINKYEDDSLETSGQIVEDKKKKKKTTHDDSKSKLVREYKKQESIHENCKFCYQGSKVFKKYLRISLGNKTMLTVPPYGSMIKGHCCIVPLEHKGAIANLDEDEFYEIARFKQSLIQYFAAKKQDVIFVETVTSYNLKKHKHAFVECIPIPEYLAAEVPAYFKKAILESDSEWSQNKKLIETQGKPISKCVPKGFPYFHVEFGSRGTGYAHVIEDDSKFSFKFAKEIITGLLQNNPAHSSLLLSTRSQNEDSEKQMVLDFVNTFEKYDWTFELD